VATRRAVLDAAFDEMYASGFRSAGIDAILAEAGATKGALYYHFGSKQGLGYAVIEERVKPLVRQRYIQPFRKHADPIHALQQMGHRMEEELLKVGILQKGCPLNNLIQEMSGVDDGFRVRLAEILDEWTTTIADGVRGGQADGTVQRDADPEALAAFVVSSYLGAVGVAKNAQDIAPFTACRGRLDAYIGTLRPAGHVELSSP
jgi:TetR/AcrR family transcriptional repressor of nem operon